MELPKTSDSLPQHIVIIGNGIAGITAARHIRKLSAYSITVISSESKYFFSRTALMYVYMGHMRPQDIEPYEPWFWDKNRINLLHDHVNQIHCDQKKLTTDSGKEIHYDKLIIACGSDSNSLDIPGIDAKGVQGFYSLQDLRYIESFSPKIKRAVIIGGGLIGIELAEMFQSRKIHVTFLVRESAFWNDVLPPEEAEMINQHILDHLIDLRLNSEVLEIQKNKEGYVNGVVTRDGEQIQCDFVGLTLGVHPNITWLKNSPLELKEGILVDEYLRTNIEDIYAIGDCAELKHPPTGHTPIEAVWYTGRMMGETVAYTICGINTVYNPGIWFNSAKFFDVEYQVYGDIPVKLPDGQMTLLWQHPFKKKCIRINYDHNGSVIGFNLMGIRFRQEVCEKWISDKYSIEDVLRSLEIAIFDPEFAENYCPHLRNVYEKSSGKKLHPVSNGKFNDVYTFLTTSKTSS